MSVFPRPWQRRGCWPFTLVFFSPALLPGWRPGRELPSPQGTLRWEQPGLEPSGMGALCLNSSSIDLSVVPLCCVGFLAPGVSFRDIFLLALC